jgi:Phosphopantetheine attachment site
MTRSISVSNDGDFPTAGGDPGYMGVLFDSIGSTGSGADEPLTPERVVAEIVQAARAIHPSLPDHGLSGETNLALDLGFESATRVKLLLEVQRALDVDLDLGAAAMFADMTIAELADLIVTLEDCDIAWFR